MSKLISELNLEKDISEKQNKYINSKNKISAKYGNITLISFNGRYEAGIRFTAIKYADEWV